VGILEPLGAGASIVLARPQFEYDSAYLVKLIADRQDTAACFVPSLLRAIVEDRRSSRAVRCVGSRARGAATQHFLAARNR
jgi:acyl-coenzyme A synthetase/AMP-(fatty) acid ligase